ncbi:hypothetical protein AKJ57_02630 [candidate division MSBL1 archaeon SCGC-AAA259A05]|uniref:NAD-dependent epimerase/dehydratase domain-containing protein n=1 Tax=candidate division MSBL1 archaeon SCGC-AAA259A05 TaxID=1698259 RepID=A0A133UA34_9EURY|nr:hypothetical protein AKJ57_02630 [candidate division MSBL1 archaeon SCGC-AAA259A05]
MKVLITGASGRLAPYVVRELEDSHELVLTSRSRPSEEFSNLDWVSADLTSIEDCRTAVKDVDAIQHLGAQSWPTDHSKHRDRAQRTGTPFDATFKANMLGTYYLMQAAVEASVSLVVMASSNCVLGHGYRISATPFPFEYLPVDEDHPCFPEDTYSYSKWAGEELLASYTRAYGIQTLVTRPAGICPEERRREIAENSGPAERWDPWLWAWVGSEDVASAHRLLLESADGLPSHDVYFLNSDDTTALESSQKLVEDLRPELDPVVEGLEGNQTFISCEKLKNAVDWKHETSWRKLL